MKRVLCLDIGEKRIGVAVSDPLGITAQGVRTLFTRGLDNDLAAIQALAGEFHTDRILAGLPRNMDGSEGFQAQKTRQFAQALSALGLRVRFQDERLTSVCAGRLLKQAGVKGDKRKQVLDKLAATYILQSFLDAGGWPEDQMEENIPMQDNQTRNGNPIVELIDEDGRTVRFEHVFTVPYEGDEYVLLSPVDPVEGVAEDEVVIMRIEPGEDEDAYVGVEDDQLLDAVFEKYLDLAEVQEEVDEAFEDLDEDLDDSQDDSQDHTQVND